MQINNLLQITHHYVMICVLFWKWRKSSFLLSLKFWLKTLSHYTAFPCDGTAIILDHEASRVLLLAIVCDLTALSWS